VAGRGDRGDDRRRALVSAPRQGEVWWAEAEDRRRPVLIVTRSEAIAVLRRLIVAPVTRTVRGIPTEVELGAAHGLIEGSVANCDNLLTIPKTALATRRGMLGPAELHALDHALRIALALD